MQRNQINIGELYALPKCDTFNSKVENQFECNLQKVHTPWNFVHGVLGEYRPLISLSIV